MRSGKKLDSNEFRQLSKLYRGATSDFAYATTYFGDHDIAGYLNKLVAEAHAVIYRRRTLKARLVVPWFFRGVPRMFRENARYFRMSAFTFILFAVLGFLGAEFMDEGEAIFLGFSLTEPEQSFANSAMYIQQTEWNIEAGEPFDVYDSPMKSYMSSRITFNNIGVAFFAFAGGIFAGIVTFYVIAKNAMMVGAFFHIFYRHDIIFDFWNTVMLHGMIELTMIVFAGGCGFMIAKGLLFPGSFTRSDSLKRMGLMAVQLAIAIAVWLVVAGLLEGFVTGRGLPDGAKVLVNLASAALLIYYWGFLGRKQATA